MEPFASRRACGVWIETTAQGAWGGAGTVAPRMRRVD